jgi:hypothetical protein
MIAADPLLQAQSASARGQVALASPGACQGFLPRLTQAHEGNVAPGKFGDHPEGVGDLP